MSKIKHNISLDMHSSVSQASLAAKQGDDNRQFAITLRSGGQPYKIERGAFAVFSTTLPDGKVIEDNCIIANDEIVYDFTQNLTSQVGVLDIEIRLYDANSKLITSPTFILVVSPRAAKAEDITSSNSFTALDNLYKDTSEAIQRADDAANFAISTARSIEEARDNGDFNGEDGEDGEDVNYDLVSNALKGTASGTSVVLADISSLEHTLRIKARGEGVDVSAARLVVSGKNLYDNSTILNKQDTSATGYKKYKIEIPNGTYTWSLKENNFLGAGVFAVFTDDKDFLGDQPTEGYFCDWIGHQTSAYYCNIKGTFTVTRGYLYLAISGSASKVIEMLETMQIEVGTTETEHEPFVKIETYPINADGTVEGVTSLYPTTTLVSDTEGIVLGVEYNRDINILTKTVPLIDRVTGIPYYLYVSGGKLLIEEREV